MIMMYVFKKLIFFLFLDFYIFADNKCQLFIVISTTGLLHGSFIKEVEIEKKEYKFVELKEIIDNQIDKDFKLTEDEKEKLEILRKDRIENWNANIKLKKFDEIIENYFFLRLYQETSNGKFNNFDFNIEDNMKNNKNLDLSDCKKCRFFFITKKERKYDFKFYPFEIDTENDEFKELCKDLKDFSSDVINNGIKEDIKKLNEYLNKKNQYFNFETIEEIIQTKKFKNLCDEDGDVLVDLLWNYESIDAEKKFNDCIDGEYGFVYLYNKPIIINVNRGNKVDKIELYIIGSLDVHSSLNRAFSKHYWLDINMFNNVTGMVKSINGASYDIEKMKKTLISSDFFDKSNIVIDENVKTETEFFNGFYDKLKKNDEKKEKNDEKIEKKDIKTRKSHKHLLSQSCPCK